MDEDRTARLGLALLQPGQAQKEATHNEALALIDIAVQPVVAAVAIDTPPAAPAIGQCWIVGTAPTGAWAGRARAIAGWTAGGWRYLAPTAGMAAWSLADGAIARFDDGAWRVDTAAPPIPAPAAGTTIDTEARTAISAVLAALRQRGIIAKS